MWPTHAADNDYNGDDNSDGAFASKLYVWETFSRVSLSSTNDI